MKVIILIFIFTNINNLYGQGIINQISTIEFKGKIKDDFSVIKATELFEEIKEIEESDLEYKRLFDSTIYIKNFGEAYVILLALKKDYPVCIPEHSFLLINKDKNKIALFPFYSFYLYKTNKTTNKYLVAGIYRERQRFYFSIYEYKNNEFFKILDTKDTTFCNMGVHIASSSPEYLMYKPNVLDYSNRDINGGSINDIIFSGKAHFVKEIYKRNRYFLKTIIMNL